MSTNLRKGKGEPFRCYRNADFGKYKIPYGVRAARVSTHTLIKHEIMLTIFEDFLPQALAQRKYAVAPGSLIET